jgi:phosphatidylinositol dimannoside acyltransferase
MTLAFRGGSPRLPAFLRGAMDTWQDLDGSFWRRAARWGARGPEWFVRLAPPVVGLIACAIATDRRRAIAENLRRVRGRRPPLREAAEVARTFVTYAACLTEVLGASPDRRPASRAIVRGELHLEDALAFGHGALLVTAHTAGWEVVGPLLARDRVVELMIVEAAEHDAAASAIQDNARRTLGLQVVHVGEDPLSALPLVKHLHDGGAVALQIDRAPRTARAREVTMFGERGRIPEGPLRLAAMTAAPIVPVFVARVGHRRYEVALSAPIRLERGAGPAALDAAAQELAARLERFVRAHPTQWFHFRSE